MQVQFPNCVHMDREQTKNKDLKIQNPARLALTKETAFLRVIPYGYETNFSSQSQRHARETRLG
jgi:hypothetical protein